MKKSRVEISSELITPYNKNYPNFTKYYNLYSKKIFNYFFYRVNCNEMVAQDLTSEVFIRVLKYYHAYDKDRSFQSWVFAIARNQFINFCKNSGREVELCENWADASDQESRVDNEMKIESIFKEINRMNPYYREVLKMRFANGFDNKQIARILKKEDNAIRSQMSRALSKLRCDIVR